MSETSASISASVLPPWYRRREFWFYFLVIAGLLFRLEYFRELSLQDYFAFALGPDVSDYHIRAQRILQGFWLPPVPDIHPPLYGFFLAFLYRLTDCSIPMVRMIQLLLGWGGWIWLACQLRRKPGAERLSLIFLGFAMFTPSVIYHQCELISESLLIPLMALFFFLDESAECDPECRRRRFFSGVAGGLLVLTHGLMLCFIVLRGVWMLCRKQKRNFFLFTGGVLLMLGMVITGKSLFYGRLTGVQENTMFNLYLGNNPEATGGCYLRPGRKWRQTHAEAEAEAIRLNCSVSRVYAGRIASFIREEPLQALVILPLRKVGMLLLPVELIAGADPGFLIYRTQLQFAAMGLAGVVLLFSLLGIRRVIREKETRFLVWLLPVLAIGAGQVLTVTAGRYRMGMMPGVLLLAALGMEKFRWKRHWWLPLLAILLTMGYNRGGGNVAEAASIIGEARMLKGERNSARNLLGYAARRLDDPARFENMLAAMDIEEGNLPGAETHYRNVLKEEPEAPDAWIGLGRILLADPGRRQEAGEVLKHYTQLAPERPEGWNFLGALRLYENDPVAAEVCFARAAELAPEHPGYRKNWELAAEAVRRRKEKKSSSPPEEKENNKNSSFTERKSK